MFVIIALRIGLDEKYKSDNIIPKSIKHTNDNNNLQSNGPDATSVGAEDRADV